MEDVPQAKPEEKEKKLHKCEQCDTAFPCAGVSKEPAGCDCWCGIYRMSSEGWANSHLFYYCSEECLDDSTKMNMSDDDDPEEEEQFKRYKKTPVPDEAVWIPSACEIPSFRSSLHKVEKKPK